MTRIVLAAALAVSALAVVPAAQANTGRPCVSGWCVGDDLPCIRSGVPPTLVPCPS